VQAWIETPLARSGWVVVDPVPTVAEQQRQAQVAREPKSDQIPPATTTPPTTRRVLPKGVSSHSRTALWISLAAAALLVMLLAAWAFGLPAMTDRRRRHALAPDAAVLAAWTSVTDRFADANVVLGSHWTPRETIQHTNGIVPFDVTRMASELWPLVDLARFGGDLATDEHAGRAWALRDEIVRISPNWPPKPSQGIRRSRIRLVGKDVVDQQLGVQIHGRTPSVAGPGDPAVICHRGTRCARRQTRVYA
jgi:hypothetical protein